MKLIIEISDWFSQQRPGGKLAIGAVGLLFFIGMCSGLSAILARSGQSPSATPTFQGADSVVLMTWTPAFTGSATPTGTATPTSSPAATRTPLPTSLPTRSFETPTTVILPATFGPGTARGLVVITGVDKQEEYVDIQNIGTVPVSLRGWVLVSERGDQRCTLSGFLQPKEVLRIWAGTGLVGYSCGFLRTIWTDSELDPAVLYDQFEQEVSRYP